MVLMDVCKGEQIQHREVTGETARRPLAPSEKNIAVARRPKTSKDVPSRYKAAITSNSTSTPVVPRRCLSPNVARVVPAPIPSYTKRTQSAERRRPSSPSSSSRPGTPVHDVSPALQSFSKRLPSSRTSEGLWPSGTMRSLCVSFQSDIFSIPVTKKEKPVNQTSSDHMLKPSAHATHRQVETPHAQRKVTPERKRTPLRGKNSSDQAENSKPSDNSHDRLIDQHRWPSRTGGKTSTIPSTRSVSLMDKASKAFPSPLTGRGVSLIRRSPMFDTMGRGLQKSQSDVATQLSSNGNDRLSHGLCATDALRSSGHHKLLSDVGISSNSSERAVSATRLRRGQLPSPGPRPASPSKTPFISSSTARGSLSPSCTRPSSPFRLTNSTSSQSSCTSSVLSFITEYRKGKRGANHLESAHQLRLLHNRYLQWRYANARADIVLSNQKIIAENTLYNVWNTISEVLNSVRVKRINLQQLRQELKLDLILNEQMVYLENWGLLEMEHSNSLTEAMTSLEACTLRLPITAGAKVDITSLKSAICSAADIMQEVGSSMSCLLSRVEGTTDVVFELAEVTKQEKDVIYECGSLLASITAMQAEENILRTHVIQLKEATRRGEQSIPIILSPV